MQKDLIFQNYHRHSHYSNVFTPDSATTNEEYAKRAVELGHKTICSMEHGFQGRYYEVYEYAKKYNLKFIFGVEAYWVIDRFEKDRTNSHMCILAKNENGRKDINRILSDANIDGYYYKPRLDLDLLLSINPKNVMITSACLTFFYYENIEEIINKLHNHFKENFFLEVQYHNTTKQKEINKRIIELSHKKGIDIIMGCDSHYIYPNDAQGRLDVLEAKGVRYEDEEGWFLDYPNGETAFNRFKEQGVLSEIEILRAMKNTNLLLEFEDIEFSKNIKLPTIYPNKTQKEKDDIYKSLLIESWNEFGETIPLEEHNNYKEAIKEEARIVINTKMADYFLLNYQIIKEGIKNGGIITKSGRGSGASFLTNTLLGFSNTDRLTSPVRLYPERFMSESRILQTGSLPDIDHNIGTIDIFVDAQKNILGTEHVYPMIAWGTFKDSSAFKLYAKSQNISFEVANEVTKQLDKYQKALLYTDDDEKDLVDVYDYVDVKYKDIYEESKKYKGIIASKSIHPCGYLLYSGDIKSELGLMKIKSETSKKEVIVTVIDGAIAEDYKFLKNDLLKTDVTLLIAKVYNRIGIKHHTVNEIMQIIKTDKKTWNVYADGHTMGVNQVEKESTTKKSMRYKPSNISELTAFIAAIRPSFKSMYNIFESREPFEYGIPSFDKILQTEELPMSFVLYQEQMMATLAYAGFPKDETYSIIKAISKKKPKIVKPLQERFLDGFREKIINDDGIDFYNATEMSKKVWQIIEDASQYGFNASHAYCYALDSVFCAYLKSNYPLEFYEVMLEYYSQKGNKNKVSKFKQEMGVAFSIKLGDLKFGNDNRGFTAVSSLKSINESMLSIKFMNQQCAEDLYALSINSYNTFIDLLIDINEKTCLDKRQLKILTEINYFEAFGKNKKLLKIIELFDIFYTAKTIKKSKYENDDKMMILLNKYSKSTDKTFKDIQSRELLNELCKDIKDEKLPLSEQAFLENEYIGYIKLKEKTLADDYYIVSKLAFKQDKNKPFIELYKINDGTLTYARIKDGHIWQDKKYIFGLFDILKIPKIYEENKVKRIDGKYETIDEKENVLKEYVVLRFG
jgi:DNA polymerase III alpha subunit